MIRSLGGEEALNIIHRNKYPASWLTPEMIHHFITSNSIDPSCEGTTGIISVPVQVNCQQRLLDKVLDRCFIVAK